LKQAMDALRAWRGEAARAKLRGMLAGVGGSYRMWRKRAEIQKMRTVSIEILESLLSPPDQR
jgi:hypothetical protein